MSETETPVAMPTSQPLLIRLFWVTGGLALVLALLSGLIGFIVSGMPGLVGAIIGALIGGVCMMLSPGSMAFANRFIGSPSYVAIFFGTVLGALLLKMILFLASALLLRHATWLVPEIMFVVIIIAVVLSLVSDLLFIAKTRVGAVSEARLHE